MKTKVIKTGLLASLILTSAFAGALELNGPDTNFLNQVKNFGLTQENWDSGEMATASFQNAWKFTHSYTIEKSSHPSEQWKSQGKLNLKAIQVNDADGTLSLEVLLRDRLHNNAMVVLKGENLVHEHYWNGLSPDSKTLVMSVTKSFTSMLAAIAVEEGKLDMNRKVQDYLPELKGSAFANSTVQEVSDMRSGIKVNIAPGLSWDHAMTHAQEWNGYVEGRLNGTIEYAKTVKARQYPTGQAYQYQCINTEVLGLVVEKTMGKKLPELFSEKVWSHLGVESNAVWQSNPTGYVVASGGLNITTRDLAKVGQMLLNSGKNNQGEQIIPKAFIDNLMEGNDEVRSAWKYSKESHLAPDAWYKDQFRVMSIKGRKMLAMVGIHGQSVIMDKDSGTVIATAGSYSQPETPRMALMMFQEMAPAIIKATENI